MLPIESQNIEYKERWKDGYLKTVCGFANANGGILYIGISDNGTAKPLFNLGQLQEDLPNKIMSHLGVAVTLELKNIKGIDLLKMVIPKSVSPVSYAGKFYRRSGSTTQELKGSQLQQLILEAGNQAWDEILMPTASWDQIDSDLVQKFVQKGSARNRLPANAQGMTTTELFERLRLSQDGILTRAAVLLFSRNFLQASPTAVCRIGRFTGKDDIGILTDDVVEVPLFGMPERIMEILLGKYLKKHFSFKGLERIEQLEYPEIALREGLLNAIVHRDYSGNSYFTVKVRDRELALWNEGELLEPLNIDMLSQNHVSRLRNKLIADIFYRSGSIEAWGTGTQRMVHSAQKEGYPAPVFSEYFKGLQVIFKPLQKDVDNIKEPHSQYRTTTGGVNGGVNGGANDKMEKIFQMILQNGGMSAKQISILTNIPLRTVERHIRSLREKNLIEFRGAPKSGGYYVVKMG